MIWFWTLDINYSTNTFSPTFDLLKAADPLRTRLSCLAGTQTAIVTELVRVLPYFITEHRRKNTQNTKLGWLIL